MKILFFILNLIVSVIIMIYPPPTTLKATNISNNSTLVEAKYWHQVCGGVQCDLCPLRCFLPEGQRGVCKVRVNWGGKLYTMVYGQLVSLAIDPIEKKPVFHMFPGSGVLSIATAGCNLKCKFCQNWGISQVKPEKIKSKFFAPQQLVNIAIAKKCKSIAYTYSEPIVFYEYVLDCAKLARKMGIKNVLVSGGFINKKPLEELANYFDVIKIDLKGFNKEFYKNTVGGELKYILNTLLTLKEKGVLLEVVNLVVPTLNDSVSDIEAMCRWIYEKLGADTPLFFSRFTPKYKLTNLPSTPIETLEKARYVAIKTGLRYVYIGNVPGHIGESTFCPRCKKIVIKRVGYAILEYNLIHGKCKFCGEKIYGIWW